MDTCIHIDYSEERLPRLQARIEGDTGEFLSKELAPLLLTFERRGGNLVALISEFQQIGSMRLQPTIHSRAYPDAWTFEKFDWLDAGTSTTCGDLLHLLYLQFEQCPIVSHLGSRFGQAPGQILDTAGPGVVFNWFLLWLSRTYPGTAYFLFGKKNVSPFETLKGIPTGQIIRFLPLFMLWGLGTCLGAHRSRALAIGLAGGAHVRRLDSCPAPFSKRMAHCFVNAPREYSFEQAVWYGIVVGLGGRQAFAEVLRGHFRSWRNRMEFIQTVVRFFSREGYPSTDRETRLVLGYLQHLHDEQGDLSLKGSTFASLRRRAYLWYEEINRRIPTVQNGFKLTGRWEGAGYRPFDLEEYGTLYRIVQLTSMEELYEEGGAMKHCVGGYGYQCQRFGTSIWSLREYHGDSFKRLVTIEVSKDRRIVQARRKMNASPNRYYLELIELWARREKLEMGV